MKKLVGCLPKTLTGLYDVVINDTPLEGELGKLLYEAGKENFESLYEIYKFLECRDQLTDAVYGQPDSEGCYVFPFAVKKPRSGVYECAGELGEQFSKHHFETVQQHICIVAAGLDELDVYDMKTIASLAVLHDCGKKYTTGTNAKGEICFYGHDIVSAYLAGCWLKNNFDANELQIKTCMAIVYSHMKPRSEWAITPANREQFKDELILFFGGDNDAYNLAHFLLQFHIPDLDAKDIGVNLDEIMTDRVQEMMERGLRIVKAF